MKTYEHHPVTSVGSVATLEATPAMVVAEASPATAYGYGLDRSGDSIHATYEVEAIRKTETAHETETTRQTATKREVAELAARLVTQLRERSRDYKLGKSSRIRVGALEETESHLEATSESTKPGLAQAISKSEKWLSQSASVNRSPSKLEEANESSISRGSTSPSTTSLLSHSVISSPTTASPTTASVLASGYIEPGCPGLGRLLSGGGYEPGSLVEWFSLGLGTGVSSLALLAGGAAMKGGKALVVVDWQSRFYPPAAAALGIDLKRLIVIRPKSREDGWWSLDQALRCSAVGAVWSSLPEEMDDRLARRLQLAAETGGTLGLFIRDFRTRNRPSWADVQWQVKAFSAHASNLSGPQPLTTSSKGRYLQVELLRCRSGAGHGGSKTRDSIWLEVGATASSHRSNWIRELTAQEISLIKLNSLTTHSTSTDRRSTHSPKQGLTRNDSHGSRIINSHTQHLAAQLAMPKSAQQLAASAAACAVSA